MSFHVADYNLQTDRTIYQAHANEFPVISQMARDFLVVMRTSVSVERLFSSS